MASGCGSDNRLLYIKLQAASPLLKTGTVHIFPTETVQFQITGVYSNRNVQTISNTQAKWTSTNPAIATIDANGLATSVGPLGVTTITADVSGHSGQIVLEVD